MERRWGRPPASRTTSGSESASERPSDAGVPFYGPHQAGITTPVQDRLHFAAFDVLEGTSRAQLADLLRTWTAAAADMTAGREIGGAAGSSDQYAPPRDTGEALGAPARAADGHRRLRALAVRRALRPGRRRPAALEPLPKFADDALDPARSDGDLCIQACADDPQVAVHAVRNLARLAHGVAAVRFSQLGFGRTSSTSTNAGHRAQPVRVQGRHAQPQGGGPGGDAAARVGGARRRRSREVDGRRLVPGRAAHPDDDRDLGPRLARRPGAGHRPPASAAERRSAARTSSRRSTSPPRDPTAVRSSPRSRTSASRIRRATAARRCCAAATRSSTAATRSAVSRPGCTSSPTSATRARSSSASSSGSPASTATR